MSSPSPPDPAAFFREMLGQWEAAANKAGAEYMKSDEAVRAMHEATSATAAAQAQAHQFMDRALAAANMPSRADVEDLSARLARIEASVGRIEALLAAQAGVTPPERAKPKRIRTKPGQA